VCVETDFDVSFYFDMAYATIAIFLLFSCCWCVASCHTGCHVITEFCCVVLLVLMSLLWRARDSHDDVSLSVVHACRLSADRPASVHCAATTTVGRDVTASALTQCCRVRRTHQHHDQYRTSQTVPQRRRSLANVAIDTERVVGVRPVELS